MPHGSCLMFRNVWFFDCRGLKRIVD